MPRPLAHLTDDELRAALRAQPERSAQTRHMVGWGAVVEWALAFGVLPGRTRALPAADLYRHFLGAGYSLGLIHRAPFVEFGICLTRLGLQQGRDRTGGADRRPRLMAQDAAEYFRAWLLEHPRLSDADAFDGLVRQTDRMAL